MRKACIVILFAAVAGMTSCTGSGESTPAPSTAPVVAANPAQGAGISAPAAAPAAKAAAPKTVKKSAPIPAIPTKETTRQTDTVVKTETIVS